MRLKVGELNEKEEKHCKEVQAFEKYLIDSRDSFIVSTRRMYLFSPCRTCTIPYLVIFQEAFLASGVGLNFCNALATYEHCKANTLVCH